MVHTSLSPGRGESTATALLSFLLVFADPAPIRAEGALVSPGDMCSGALLLESVDSGRYLEAPRMATDVAIRVTGPIARTRVTQRFENPSDAWVEGVYVFPLPSGAAVDTLRLQVGERFLEGEIQERARAREIYEKAAAAGRKASLVEQQRPNLFRNAVANIGPGESVIVQIEYQEAVRLDGDEFSLRVPLTVTPRASASGDEAVELGAGEVAPLALRVELDAGVPLAGIESEYHDVRIAEDGERAIVSLAAPAPPDRDFVLAWKLAPSAAPQAALFRESVGGATYYLGLVVPPAGAQAPRRQPRETLFVIDDSGSMAGESMRQAQAALALGLRALEPGDRFNVIRFDDTVSALFPRPVPADRANLDAAQHFVAALSADGGTAILPALQAALADATPDDRAHLRQVIFLTDGAVANEDAVLATIEASLGRSRLFTVGIGSAPNSYLMEHVARLGRGTFTHVGSELEVDRRMTELFAKLESPVMTDLRVVTDGAELETWPNPVPDLYAGEPVVISARDGGDAEVLRMAGRIGASAWSSELALADARDGSGVAKLWGRAKIGAIDLMRFQGVDAADIDAEVLKIALAHHLVSRLTSLVAVDVAPSRPADASLQTIGAPLALPHGWDFGAVMAAPARGARPGARTLASLVQRPNGAARLDGGIELPRTDLGTDVSIVLGALLALGGGLALQRLRRPAPRPC
jgi:Ca-activated chloride channel family protein